jgi:EAL domain-containing protein (putative c-di-GMP-specific phosphodiesterase class I)/GGDEF domain-containing protein
VSDPAHAAAGPPETRVLLLVAPGTAPEPLVRTTALAGATPVAVESEPAAAAALAIASGVHVVLADLRLGPVVVELAGALAERAAAVRVAGLWSGQDTGALLDLLAAGVTCFAGLEAAPEELAPVLDGAREGRPTIAPGIAATLFGGVVAELRDGGGLRDRSRMAEDVRRRFAEPGALQAVFQPIADLRTRDVVGFLALTRFTGEAPERTGRRFAEARSAGLAGELELAAARQALADARGLPAAAALFVKVACPTVATGGLDELLAGGGLAERVVLELSDHAGLTDHGAFYAAVERLRAHGVRFAVDETGAGFGALDHVLDLAPAFVRLAGGLTRDIDTDRTRRALALAVTSFASHLGARVVADRIETEEELQALRRLGVHLGIGFHVGRPEPAPPPPAEPRGDPAAAAEDAEPAEAPVPAGRLVWAHARAGGLLPVPHRARTSLEEAARGVLRALADRLPPGVAYVGHADHESRLFRVVDVEARELPALEPGGAWPLDATVDAAALAGNVAQAGSSTGAPVLAGGVPARSWACVPFHGTGARPVAVLSVAAGAPDAFGDDVLELLRDGGAILSEALERELAGDAGRADAVLRELSWRDRATGVLNALRFRELLEEANARAAASAGGTYVVHARLANFDALAQRMGQAMGELVRKDVARALALHAEQVDAVGRMGPTTFGAVLFGRRAGEVEFFVRSVADRVAAATRRRGVTAELRLGTERLGLGADVAVAWQAAGDRATP